MKKEIRALVKWLDKNNASELASKLGYKTSTTIHAWIKADRIPARQRAAVLAIIEGTNYVVESSDKGQNQTTNCCDNSRS